MLEMADMASIPAFFLLAFARAAFAPRAADQPPLQTPVFHGAVAHVFVCRGRPNFRRTPNVVLGRASKGVAAGLPISSHNIACYLSCQAMARQAVPSEYAYSRKRRRLEI
jgi:hypothetical protein